MAVGRGASFPKQLVDARLSMSPPASAARTRAECRSRCDDTHDHAGGTQNPASLATDAGWSEWVWGPRLVRSWRRSLARAAPGSRVVSQGVRERRRIDALWPRPPRADPAR